MAYLRIRPPPWLAITGQLELYMEPEPVVIRWVSIQNFRGFRAERTIDLAASATIVSGSNGKGKTSFFDALQWLLLGSPGRPAGVASGRRGGARVNPTA